MIRILKKEWPEFEDLYWVLLAIKPQKSNDGRLPLTYLKSAVDPVSGWVELMGCNGYSLHRFRSEIGEYYKMFESGLYAVIKASKSEIILDLENNPDIIYPDIDNILPNVSNINDWETLARRGDIQRVSIDYTRAILLLPADTSLDFSYFSDLVYTDGSLIDREICCFSKGGLPGLYMLQDRVNQKGRSGLVMGLKMDAL